MLIWRRVSIANGVPALLQIAVGVVVIMVSLDFPDIVPPGDPGFGFFPQLIAVALIGLSVVQAFQGPDSDSLPGGREALRVIGVLGTFILYALAFRSIGFIASTVLFGVALLVLSGARRLSVVLLYPVVLAFGLYLPFVNLLRVRLPQGVIEALLGL